jgi:predicted lipoprotein with Yx(FWY)xxD motif
VKVAYNAKLKRRILVTGAGMTLYAYTTDYRNLSMCVNDATYHCSKAWPPLRTTRRPVAGRGVEKRRLRSIKRADGTRQVTYYGRPLYTDAGSSSFGLTADTKPGDVNGEQFAGAWFAVSPRGKLVR